MLQSLDLGSGSSLQLFMLMATEYGLEPRN